MPMRRWTLCRCMPWVASLVWLGAPGVRADVVHLVSGGSLEGELLESDPGQYRLRTLYGTVAIPAESVTEVERGPSVLQQYDAQRAAAAESADGRVALAQWCREHDLMPQARKHFEEALGLDRDHAVARQALGYVRVAGLWVDGRTSLAAPASAPASGADEPAADDPDERERLLRAVQADWYGRIKAIQRNLLESSLPRLAARGAEQIREIRDPLAVVPLSRVLSEGTLRSRQLLVEMLKTFDNDEATMNLAVLALMDGDGTIRRQAALELAERNDPRVVPELRRALFSDSDFLIRNAAVTLGLIGAQEAVPDLIEVLTAQRVRRVQVSVAEYFNGLRGSFRGQVRAQIGSGVTLGYAPRIGVGVDPGLLGPWSGSGAVPIIPVQYRLQAMKVLRTDVLEALKSLTGENFGFDVATWQRWYEENRP